MVPISLTVSKILTVPKYDLYRANEKAFTKYMLQLKLLVTSGILSFGRLIKSIMFSSWTPSSLFSPKVKPHGRTWIKNGLKKGLNLIKRWQLHPISIYRSQKRLATSVFLGYYVQSWINEGKSLPVLLTCSYIIHSSFLVNLIHRAALKHNQWCQLPQAYRLNGIYLILLKRKTSMKSVVIFVSLTI